MNIFMPDNYHQNLKAHLQHAGFNHHKNMIKVLRYMIKSVEESEVTPEHLEAYNDVIIKARTYTEMWKSLKDLEWVKEIK